MARLTRLLATRDSRRHYLCGLQYDTIRVVVTTVAFGACERPPGGPSIMDNGQTLKTREALWEGTIDKKKGAPSALSSLNKRSSTSVEAPNCKEESNGGAPLL
jgi:hypothetical protein